MEWTPSPSSLSRIGQAAREAAREAARGGGEATAVVHYCGSDCGVVLRPRHGGCAAWAASADDCLGTQLVAGLGTQYEKFSDPRQNFPIESQRPIRHTIDAESTYLGRQGDVDKTFFRPPPLTGENRHHPPGLALCPLVIVGPLIGSRLEVSHVFRPVRI